MNEVPPTPAEGNKSLSTPIIDLTEAVKAVKSAAAEAAASFSRFSDSLSPKPLALNRAGRRALAKSKRKKGR